MRIRHAAGKYLALTVLVSSCIATAAVAQAPTPEQQAAIRGSCRSDFMARCSGVQPGGADALACLRKNVAQLSPACQTAVNAATPKPAPAAAAPAAPPPAPAARASAPPAASAASASAPASPAPASAPPAAAPAPAAAAQPTLIVPSADQVAAIRASCPADFTAHCAGVPPGGAEGLACLQRNAAKLSPPCRFAVGGTGAAAPASAAAPARAPAPQPAAAPPPARTAAKPPAAPAPAATATPSPPTAEQQAAIRSSCRNDFMAKCSGVQPGGADALACLKRNAAQLSAPCRTAVSAIGAPQPAAAPAAATAAPAASAAMPTPAQQNAIKATCRRDFMTNCRGVQPGGPEAFACLQRNSARLSPDCRISLAAITDPGVAATTPPATATAAAPAAGPAGPGLFPLRRAIRERMMGN